MFIYPVNSKGILKQVVCADGKEIYLFGDYIRSNGRRWNLYHGAHEYLWVERHLFPSKLFLGLFHNVLCRPQFLHAGYHGEHHLDVAENTGPYNTLKLCLKYLRLLDTKPDSPEPHRRIHLGGKLYMGKEFIASYIQCAYDCWMGRNFFRNIFIYLKMLIFGRKALPVEVHKLCPVESYPLSPVVNKRRNFINHFYVPHKPYPSSVLHLSRQLFIMVEQLFVIEILPLFFLILFYNLF